MKLGIFAKTFVRANVAEAFAAIKSCGLECVQFNFSCAGLPTLPDSIEPSLVRQIGSELKDHALCMAAVSGTCNLIHPQSERREKDLASLERLICAAEPLGTRVVTLCTGTRDGTDMWRAHPDNHSPAAWRDLVDALERLLPIAQECGVILGVEPEPANVVDSAPRARTLLDELKSPSLKVIFDAANLLSARTLADQDRILSEAIELLGPEIVVAHAKDLATIPHAGHVATGKGGLDYDLYLSKLRSSGFKGPLILHSLTELEVPAAVDFLRQHLRHVRELQSG